MKIPKGMNRNRVIEIISRVCKRLANKYRFGYYTRDDIFQEAFIMGIEGLESYDSTRPLENFLSVHISNRLKNFKRDNYFRQEDCRCEAGCERCEKRRETITQKKNVMEPLNLSNVRDEFEKNMWTKLDFLRDMEIDEMMEAIDNNLDCEMRADYLRLRDGVTVPKKKREKLEQRIIEILEENGYGQVEDW